MKNFNEPNFEIKIERTEDDLIMIKWLGRCNFKKPLDLLEPYFKELIAQLSGEKDIQLEINFEQLEYMSSSTIIPILNLIRDLNKEQLKSSFIYKSSSSWQRASFKAFKAVAAKLDYVEVKGR